MISLLPFCDGFFVHKLNSLTPSLFLERDDDDLDQTDERAGEPGPECVDFEIFRPRHMTLPSHREKDSTGDYEPEEFYPAPPSLLSLI